jgi:hypothetical protein
MSASKEFGAPTVGGARGAGEACWGQAPGLGTGDSGSVPACGVSGLVPLLPWWWWLSPGPD